MSIIEEKVEGKSIDPVIQENRSLVDSILSEAIHLSEFTIKVGDEINEQKKLLEEPQEISLRNNKLSAVLINILQNIWNLEIPVKLLIIVICSIISVIYSVYVLNQ